MFSCEFCEISKNTFSTEHLQETASDIKFIYIENIVRLVYLLFYRDFQIFDLTGGFLFFCSWWPAEE